MVTALRAGDQLAIGQIYDTYGARLYAYCYDLLADHELAADALRDAFIVANNRIRELANPDELGAWLYALSRSEALRLGVSDDIPADAAQGTRNDRFARAALDVYAMLPPESREILDLAFRHRMVDGDLALVMDMSEEQIGQVVAGRPGRPGERPDRGAGQPGRRPALRGDRRARQALRPAGRQGRRALAGGGRPGTSRHDQACADHIENRRPLRLFEELPHAFVPPGVRARVLDTLRDPAGAAFCERIADPRRRLRRVRVPDRRRQVRRRRRPQAAAGGRHRAGACWRSAAWRWRWSAAAAASRRAGRDAGTTTSVVDLGRRRGQQYLADGRLLLAADAAGHGLATGATTGTGSATTGGPDTGRRTTRRRLADARTSSSSHTTSTSRRTTSRPRRAAPRRRARRRQRRHVDDERPAQQLAGRPRRPS